MKCETLEKEAREMKCETLRLRERERYVKGESEEARFREQEMKVENEKLKKEVGELKKKYGEMKGKYKALMQESYVPSQTLFPHGYILTSLFITPLAQLCHRHFHPAPPVRPVPKHPNARAPKHSRLLGAFTIHPTPQIKIPQRVSWHPYQNVLASLHESGNLQLSQTSIKTL